MKSKIVWVLSLAAVILLLLAGCLSESLVTQRPVYAYPQNLVSLCGQKKTLVINNRGNFVTADYTNKLSELMLSPQFLETGLENHRHIISLRFDIEPDGSMTVEAEDSYANKYQDKFKASEKHCRQDGEFVVSYPKDGFYFWASYGSKTREVAVWTNSADELILQNRWSETQSGLVSGKVSGDAWALFRVPEMIMDAENAKSLASADRLYTNQSVNNSEGINLTCQSLSGVYMPEGEALNPDGSIYSRNAAAHFFREELTGQPSIDQKILSNPKLQVLTLENGSVKLDLMNQDLVVASRLLDSKQLSCKAGKWFYEGGVKGHSPLLLVAASAGVYWEDMTLWRDKNGDLLVDGVYKTKGLLLLVPFGRTESAFIAFPRFNQVNGSNP